MTNRFVKGDMCCDIQDFMSDRVVDKGTIDWPMMGVESSEEDTGGFVGW